MKIKFKSSAIFLIVWFVLAIAFVAAFVFLPSSSGEQIEDDTYYLQDYQVRYEYDGGRTFRVTEEITAVFTVSGKHGIIRDLPYNSGEIYKNIVSDDVFDTEMANGFISVYLGDEHRTVPSRTPVNYTLTYRFTLPASAGRDTVYLNLIGGGWTTRIENATCTLVLPAAPEGSILINESDFEGSYSVSGNTVTVSAENLSAFTPVTVQCTLPEGTLGALLPDSGEIAALLIAAALLVAAILLAVLLPKHEPTPVTTFTPPDDIDPLLAGALIDGKVQSGDITSLLYYWANQGLLTIDFSDEKDPILHKIGELKEDAPIHQKYVFNRLFSSGDTVNIQSLSESFYTTAGKAKHEAEKLVPSMYSKGSAFLTCALTALSAVVFALTLLFHGMDVQSSIHLLLSFAAAVPLIAICAIGYWSHKNSLRVSKKVRVGILIGQIAIAAAFTAIAFFSIPQTVMLRAVSPFFCLLTAAAALVAPFTLRRTKEYVRGLNELLGFREFIRLAEKERLEMLLEEDPEYYYNVLPYAQVLGVSDIWEDKFKDLKTEPPTWALAPNDTLFNFVLLNSMMRTASRNMRSAFVSRPAPSGGSGGGGFGGGGGGGFSGGGGFGGGGGRSW